MPTVTGAEFNQRPSQVKRAAETEPVVITEHSRPSFVLMTYAEYQRLHNAPTNLAEWLKMDDPEGAWTTASSSDRTRLRIESACEVPPRHQHCQREVDRPASVSLARR